MRSRRKVTLEQVISGDVTIDLEVSSRLLESHACHTSCILKWHATAILSQGKTVRKGTWIPTS